MSDISRIKATCSQKQGRFLIRKIKLNMAFRKKDDDQGDNFTPRPKVQGKWKCSECGTEITELPFEPKEGQPIFCFDCWKKQRDAKFQK